jgi:protein-disulfide isomerase
VTGRPRIPLLLFLLLGLAACNPLADHRELVRMRLRVDSLARTVTAMNAALGGRSSAPQPAETLTVSTKGVAMLGDSSAPVTIVEFTDFQCPFCGRHATTTLPELRSHDIKAGKVRYIVRDLPISEIHPWAVKAAVAARCARVQSEAAYWRYHDALFANQRALADSLFPVLAVQVGLDTARFAACRASGKFDKAVESDRGDAMQLGLNATPTFVVGPTRPDGEVTGPVIQGAQPLPQFEAAIAAAQGR